MKKFITNILLFLFCSIVLSLCVKGLAGNPTVTDISALAWRENGPLELSPERGRYALLYSLVEDKSFAFSVDIARFAAPDVGYTGTHYASLFAPGVSFLVIPGYLFGKMFGFAQVGSFAVIAFFAVLNVFLVRAIAIRLGAHSLAATMAGITFLFATPAFTYATTLYQHHVSTFIILASIYLLVRFNSWLSLALIWMLCAFSLSVDYPNLFMIFPIAIAAIGKTLIFKKKDGAAVLSLPFLRILAVVGVILPFAFFFWFNKMSYDNPLQLAGGIDQVTLIKENGEPDLSFKLEAAKANEESKEVQKSVLNFFKNRNMINGFYTHFVSPDRGMLFYTPVMFLGIVGIFFALRKKHTYVSLLLAVMGFNIVLYSMWGDPYGGWAFGSRYLIPTYAISAIFIAIGLTYLKKYNLFLIIFFMLFSYSVAINTLGAVTSSRNPPQVEVLGLEAISGKEEKYTYQRNIERLQTDESKSFVYQTYIRSYLSAWEYYTYITLFVIIVTASILLVYKTKEEEIV